MSRGLCVCSRAKVIISVGTGSMPLGLRGRWWWWASICCFTQVLNTDRNGPFKGSHSKWGRSDSDVQLAFRQPCSHSYSVHSFQYRLPLLTSLIAFSQSLGYVFDESIKTLWIAKQAKPKISSGKWCMSLYLFCIMLHIHLSFFIISSGLWHIKFWIPYRECHSVQSC